MDGHFYKLGLIIRTANMRYDLRRLLPDSPLSLVALSYVRYFRHLGY